MALAASLTAAPPAAYAGDVPTPELKKSYLLDEIDDAEPSGFMGASKSGKYSVFIPGDNWGSGYSSQFGIVLDAKDGSTFHVPMSVDSYNYFGSYCFSSDEKTMFGVDPNGETDNDPDRATVNVVDLSSKKTKQYPLSPDCFAYDSYTPRIQSSKDGSLLYMSEASGNSSGDSDTASYTAHFCVYDYKNGKVSSQCQFTSSEDSTIEDTWVSTDGKYGYVIEKDRKEVGDDYRYTDYVVTIDVESGKTVSREELKGMSDIADRFTYSGGKNDNIAINDDGALVDLAFFVSKKGGVVRVGGKNGSNAISRNRDGSRVLVAGTRKGGSSEETYASLSVVDTKTGKTVSQSNSGLSYNLLKCGVGPMSSDGSYMAAWQDDGNARSLRLFDTKTGACSKIKLKGYTSYDAGYDDVWSSYCFFSGDNSKIYVVSSDTEYERANRVDVYDSNIFGASAAAAGSVTSSSFGSGVGPVAIVAGAAVVVVVVVGGFFIVRARKASKAVATSSASAGAPVASQPMVPQAGNPQQVPSQAQQAPAPDNAPRFCAACGSPLVPGARFCPRCGAPVKR